MASVAVWTYQLISGTLTITGDMGLNTVAMYLASGSATVIGSGRIGSKPAAALPLPSTQGFVISAGVGNVIDSLTIDASSGTVYIVGQF